MKENRLDKVVNTRLSPEDYLILVNQSKKMEVSVSRLTRNVLTSYIDEIKYWKEQR